MMIFDKVLAVNSGNANAMAAQYAALNAHRSDYRHALNPALFAGLQVNSDRTIGHRLVGNAGAAPGDLYKEFDKGTIRQFRLDEGDNILNALMPLAKSVPIGRTVLENTAASGLGGFQSSMSGELAQIYDSVDYSGDKFIIPVHQNAFKRGWREGMQLSLEEFDDAVTQNMEATRTHRNGLIDYLMNGNPNLAVDGVRWLGFRADPRVHQVDLGALGLNFDFTSDLNTGADTKAAFIELRDQLRLVNKVAMGITFFVSNEILSNLERDYSDAYNSGSMLLKLKALTGVEDIIGSSKLEGNEILAIPLYPQYIQPIVGMGVGTIALPRPNYNSPFAFDVVSAMGLKVVNDYQGINKGVMYASS